MGNSFDSSHEGTNPNVLTPVQIEAWKTHAAQCSICNTNRAEHSTHCEIVTLLCSNKIREYKIDVDPISKYTVLRDLLYYIPPDASDADLELLRTALLQSTNDNYLLMRALLRSLFITKRIKETGTNTIPLRELTPRVAEFYSKFARALITTQNKRPFTKKGVPPNVERVFDEVLKQLNNIDWDTNTVLNITRQHLVLWECLFYFSVSSTSDVKFCYIDTPAAKRYLYYYNCEFIMCCRFIRSFAAQITLENLCVTTKAGEIYLHALPVDLLYYIARFLDMACFKVDAWSPFVVRAELYPAEPVLMNRCLKPPLAWNECFSSVAIRIVRHSTTGQFRFVAAK